MLFISVIAYLGVFITLATYMSGANAELVCIVTFPLSDNFLCFHMFSVVLRMVILLMKIVLNTTSCM